RPLRSLIHPRPDHGYLFGFQRAGRWHLRPGAVASDPRHEQARTAVARTDDSRTRRAAAHRVATPIQPEPVHLLAGAVAAVALLPQDRLHVAAEVDACRNLFGLVRGRRG